MLEPMTLELNGKTLDITSAIDGWGPSTAETDEITHKLTTALPVPTRSGYVFGGWYTKKEGGGDAVYEEYKFYADTTVYANWVQEKTIQVQADEGETVGTGPTGTNT